MQTESALAGLRPDQRLLLEKAVERFASAEERGFVAVSGRDSARSKQARHARLKRLTSTGVIGTVLLAPKSQA